MVKQVSQRKIMPKRVKTPPPDPKQLSLISMFAKKSKESESNTHESTEDAQESKQNVLVDLFAYQVKNENDWAIMFDLDFHFIDTSSQQINSKRDVEIDSAETTEAEQESDDGENSEDDSASVSTVSTCASEG